jgi:hypothetical protein
MSLTKRWARSLENLSGIASPSRPHRRTICGISLRFRERFEGRARRVLLPSIGPYFGGVVSKLEGCGYCATPKKAGQEDGGAQADLQGQPQSPMSGNAINATCGLWPWSWSGSSSCWLRRGRSGLVVAVFREASRTPWEWAVLPSPPSFLPWRRPSSGAKSSLNELARVGRHPGTHRHQRRG